MIYLKFVLPMLVWAWIVSSTYSRYVTPFVGTIIDSFRENESQEQDSLNRTHIKIASVSVQAVIAISQMYLLGIWSVYCVLRTIHYTHLPGIEHVWIYHVTALILCEVSLGVIAHREEYRGILSILHSVAAMGMFCTFSLNPYAMIPIYSWMVEIMDKNGLFS